METENEDGDGEEKGKATKGNRKKTAATDPTKELLLQLAQTVSRDQNKVVYIL